MLASESRSTVSDVPARKRSVMASITSSGPRYMVVSLSTLSMAGSACTMARRRSSVRFSMPSPTSSSLLSNTITNETKQSSTPMAMEDAPSSQGSPSFSARKDADQRDEQSDERRRVL